MKRHSRSEAKAKGLTRYFTGQPCQRGHVAERSVGDRKCVECEVARNALRRQKPEYKAYEAARRRTPERKAYTTTRHRSPEYKARAVARRQTPEYKARAVARSQTPGRKAYDAAYKALRRARILGCLVELSDAERRAIARLYSLASNLEAMLGEPYHVDHNVPLARGASTAGPTSPSSPRERTSGRARRCRGKRIPPHPACLLPAKGAHRGHRE